jgi:large subunit ribosomal protein L21
MELTQMYAVIQTGGKQYRVEEGTTLKIEKLELGMGDSVEFDNVLMIKSDDAVKVGQPYVDGGKVTATVNSRQLKLYKENISLQNNTRQHLTP